MLRLCALVLGVMLFYQPVTKAVYHALNGYNREDNREVLAYFNRNYISGDPIYLNTSGIYAFGYYAGYMDMSSKFVKETVGIWHGKLTQGVSVGKFYDQLAPFRGKMVAAFKYAYIVFDKTGMYDGYLLLNQPSKAILVAPDMPFELPRHNRVWVFLSHVKPEVQKTILESFDRHGKNIEKFEKHGAAVYLYDLSD